jgi:hypothetical protein
MTLIRNKKIVEIENAALPFGLLIGLNIAGQSLCQGRYNGISDERVYPTASPNQMN